MDRFKSKGIRVATKVQEKAIKETASRLKVNPAMVLPECDGECRKCHFKKLQSKLENLKGADEKKLTKYSSGKDLVAAVAGTVLLADSKIPYFAAREIGGNTYVYAKRGNAKDEKLLAVQNFNDPHIRMLGIVDVATKKKVYLYSLKDRMICRGGDATPPEDFVKFLMNKLGLENGMCKHMSKDGKRTHIKIKWIPADMELKICEECASRNTVMEMTKYFYSPNIEKEFEVTVEGEFVSCNKKCDTCLIEDALEQHVDDSEYLGGKIDDRKFIDYWHKKIQWNIEKIHEGIFIMDNVCYGKDIDAVVEKLSPSRWEEIAIRHILERIGRPMLISNATPNKILSKYWDEYGEDIVRSIAGGRGVEMMGSTSKHTPSEILEKIYTHAEKQKVLDELPRYGKLPPLAEFADRIARAYRVGGSKEAVREIHGEKMDVKKKAIAYAFLLAIGKSEGEEWKYSDMERDFGSQLKEYASRLLESKGKDYGNALQEMLTMTGSTKRLK